MRTHRVAAPALAIVITLLVTAGAFAQSTAIKGFIVDSTGNLGVGTNAPQSTLHVAGDALINGVFKGGGVGGQFGSAAVISGFDNRYGQRSFVFSYDNGAASPQTAIQIQAIDPVHQGQSVFKTFVIDNPRLPDRYLVHAAIEGPEGAVYYRGSAVLRNGRAVIYLPTYFERLTRAEGRTVLLTNVDGFDRLAVRSQHGVKIAGGRLIIEAQNKRSHQRFDWEVKAVRADGPPLDPEPLRSEISVRGFGPYTYAAPASAVADLAMPPSSAGASQ